MTWGSAAMRTHKPHYQGREIRKWTSLRPRKTCSLRGRACSHAPLLVATPFPPAHAPFPWWPRPSLQLTPPSPGGHAPSPGGHTLLSGGHAPFLLTSQNLRLGQHPPLASPAPPLSLLQEQKRLQLLDGISMAKVSWICSRGRCPRMLQENRSEMQRHQKRPQQGQPTIPQLSLEACSHLQSLTSYS